MIKIVACAVIFIGLIPTMVLFYLFLYKIYFDLRKKEFENKGNIVLSRSRIGEVFKHSTPFQSLGIFKSAICDHSKVEGIRYYTKYPFGLKIVTPHDDHRKSFIAYEIGNMLMGGTIRNGDLDLYSDILLYLVDYSREAYYTQLIVWNSLSKLVRLQKLALITHIGIDYLKECVSKDTLRGIGVVKFIFNLKEYRELDDIMSKIIEEMIYYIIEKGTSPLVALLVFKLCKSSYFTQSQKREFMARLPDNPKFNRFMRNMECLCFGYTQEELGDGMMNLGLLSPPYSRSNTEGEIVQILLKDFIEEIYVPTSYILSSYGLEDHRELYPDFLWY